MDLHDLADLDHIAGLFDVAVRQFTDMHQPVLMDPDVDKGSEFGHVGDDAFKCHACVKVADLLHALPKAGRKELVARITSGPAQLFENVVQSVDTGGYAAFVEVLEQRWLLYQL